MPFGDVINGSNLLSFLFVYSMKLIVLVTSCTITCVLATHCMLLVLTCFLLTHNSCVVQGKHVISYIYTWCYTRAVPYEYC